ncbi:outer membrane lipoprotein-sorting protein, partial [Pseudomonas sp. GW247-3R2A]
LKVWIDKQNFLVMRQDFFDVKGVLVKQMRTQKVDTIDSIDSIVLSETEHFIDGTRSEMRFNHLQYNVQLEDRLFTQTAIKRGLKTGDVPDFAVSAR